MSVLNIFTPSYKQHILNVNLLLTIIVESFMEGEIGDKGKLPPQISPGRITKVFNLKLFVTNYSMEIAGFMV